MTQLVLLLGDPNRCMDAVLSCDGFVVGVRPHSLSKYCCQIFSHLFQVVMEGIQIPSEKSVEIQRKLLSTYIIENNKMWRLLNRIPKHIRQEYDIENSQKLAIQVFFENLPIP